MLTKNKSKKEGVKKTKVKPILDVLQIQLHKDYILERKTNARIERKERRKQEKLKIKTTTKNSLEEKTQRMSYFLEENTSKKLAKLTRRALQPVDSVRSIDEIITYGLIQWRLQREYYETNRVIMSYLVGIKAIFDVRVHTTTIYGEIIEDLVPIFPMKKIDLSVYKTLKKSQKKKKNKFVKNETSQILSQSILVTNNQLNDYRKYLGNESFIVADTKHSDCKMYWDEIDFICDQTSNDEDSSYTRSSTNLNFYFTEDSVVANLLSVC